MKDRLDKNNDITSNSKQIEILKKNFPNCFDKYGKFIPEKLNEIVSKEVDITDESYSLNWLGKSYARLLANQEVTTMLKEDKEHNNKEENKNSDNIYIEGDNLEVLKHMVNAYSEKIKMIYIDPPYNTGTDFIYQDDRKFSKEELSKLANIDEEEAQRILDFTNSKSNSHSAWLTFMYPRLYVARELLKEDGVIFISIDDNEQAQLKLLCDEVFGEENYIGEIIRNTNSTKNQSSLLSMTHENCMIYGRNKQLILNIYSENKWSVNKNNTKAYLKVVKDLKNKNLSSEEITKELKELTKYPRYVDFVNYWYIDDRGLYRKGDLGGVKNGNMKAVYNPLTGKEDRVPPGGFRYNEKKLEELIKKNYIHFHEDGSLPTIKRYLHENLKQRPKGIMSDDQRPDNSFFKKNKIYFDNPKQIAFINRIVSIYEKESIILDFFSGSATTAHAVMDLNTSDNGNRKFIMINIPESIDKDSNKSAYDFCVNELKEEPVITTIGKERIRRAAKKIYEDNQDKEYINNIDLGFKVYKTVDVVKTNYFDNLERLEVGSQVNLLNDSLSVEDIESLLLTWKLYDGIEFNEEFNIVDFNGYNGYYIDNKLYLMDKGFDNSKIKLLLEKLDDDSTFNVRKIILFAVNFNSKELMEIEEAVKGYENKKEIELEIEKRY